jgi:aspartate 1-decarboxylase
MLIQVCKSKITNAVVTKLQEHYEGSITIDFNIMKKVNLYPYEKVLVINQENGERFETYVIKGVAGSRDIILNGPAAKKGKVGDRLIIMGFGILDIKEAKLFKPKIIDCTKPISDSE